MQQGITAWLKRRVEFDHEREGSIAGFALRVTGKAVPTACLINSGVHCALVRLDLLPYPLIQGLFVGLATTASVSFVVSFLLALVVGRSIRDLKIERSAFAHLSRTDALSGVSNRHAFFEYFEKATEAGELVLIDVDHFKAINDTYGHLAGDDVIRGIGQLLRAMFVDTPDVIGRIGGEEFAVFVPDKTGIGSDPAEAIRAAIATMSIVGIEGSITISLGVAAVEPLRSTNEIYSAADRALYLAKAMGRNRVMREVEIDKSSCCREAPVEEGIPVEALQAAADR